MHEGPNSSRRSFLGFLGKGALAGSAATLGLDSGAEARDAARAKTPEKQENLWNAIQDLETKLSASGVYTREFNDPATPPQRVGEIFDEIQRVLERMDLADMVPGHPDIDSRVYRRLPAPLKQLHGLQQLKLSRYVTKLDGTKVRVAMIGTGYYISFGGNENFFVTNRHCVEGMDQDAQGQFKNLGSNGEDLAVRYEPNYRGPAIMMDKNQTDSDVQGRMTMMRSKDRFGKDSWRLSFAIKMNPTLYGKIYPRDLTGDEARRDQVQNNFAFIMRPGDTTADMENNFAPKGQSGTPIFVWRGSPESGGYQPALTFFAFTTSAGKCGNDHSGLCAPLGYAVGVDALKALCESAKSGWTTETHPAGGGYVTRKP